MPTFDAPGTTLAYEVEGKGPPVVQLHGLTSCRERDARLGLDLGRSLGRRGLRRQPKAMLQGEDEAWPCAGFA